MNRYNLKQFLQRFIDEPEKTELLTIMSGIPQPQENGPWIAGGALRRTLINQKLESDIDYFFRDESQMLDFVEEIKLLGFVETNRNEHCITFKGRPSIGETLDGSGKLYENDVIVQAICITYYEKIEDVIDSFDFTITQFGYDGKDLVCGEYALWDLARRRLALHKMTYGVSTMRRLIKYSRQGFTACGGVLANMLEAVIENPSSVRNDVKYVD